MNTASVPLGLGFVMRLGAMSARRAGLVWLMSLGACQWGTTPKKLNPLLTASGVQVAITLPVQTWPLRGELYAVDSTGAMVKADLLTQVPWSAMRSMDVVGFGTGFDMPTGMGMSIEHRERLRLISRFPQGLNGSLLTRVLQTLRQDSVLVLVPMTP
jgi:hypothetical protein